MTVITANAKALIAAAVAFLGAVQVGLTQDGLDAAELVGAAVAGLVAFGGVYGVRNAGQADAQAVVDQVRALVPAEARAAIDEAVADARGVLKTVT
ncbi:hypothetical protein GCM10009547_49470 [Sporichthya brevicatena]|uniref:Holin n=1 Tax=Sporichthya brevicatena TaxID=171442 RepID=A0ABP3SKY4_9ACTN